MRELQALAPYAPDMRPVPVQAILTQRKWLNHYGGAAWRRTGAEFELAALKLGARVHG